MSDIDTVVVDSLKALDPERPIREVVDSLKALDPERPIREADIVDVSQVPEAAVSNRSN